MGSDKRASMREGPLAELFRKTAQDEDPKQEAAERPAERPSRPREDPLPRHEQPRPAPSALRPEEDEPHVPSAKERLNAAFSQDIPSDLLERPRGRDRQYRPREEPRIEARDVRRPILRVVGVGGAGVNAVDRMIEAGVEGVEFIAVNTDLQSLQESAAHVTLHIGSEITHGLGSGSDPAIGRTAAFSDDDRIKSLLKGSDMVFVTAGAGGGTGTGAAPVVAGIARAIGALTVGVVTRPFEFEGSRRAGQAEEGVNELAKHVDTLIVIPNNRLLSVLDRDTTMVDAFRVADDVLRQGVQGISDLVTLPGLINLDFADVRTIMSDAGSALMGIGQAGGENRATEAAKLAISSPLLEESVEGATGVLLNITGGRDLGLFEVNEAAEIVQGAADANANIIFGSVLDESLGDEVRVTVIATGFDHGRARPRSAREETRLSAQSRDRSPRVERESLEISDDDIDIPPFLR
jgi:cell division protein FtsZ